MRDFLDIPEKCRQSTLIPADKFSEMDSCVESIEIIGVLKPDLAPVTYSSQDKMRSEEILILQVKMATLPEDVFSVLRVFFKELKYHCVVVLTFKGKHKLSSCRFSVGKNDYNANILKMIKISCWIHTDIMSSTVSKSVDIIRKALNSEDDLASIYLKIHTAIVDMNQKGTSLAHARRIVSNLMGHVVKGEIEQVLQYCTPIEYHQRISNYGGRYAKSQRASNYWLLHDYEDIWYGLNKYDRSRRIIEGQYENMEELLYYVEGEKWY